MHDKTISYTEPQARRARRLKKHAEESLERGVDHPALADGKVSAAVIANEVRLPFPLTKWLLGMGDLPESAPTGKPSTKRSEGVPITDTPGKKKKTMMEAEGSVDPMS